MIKNYIKIAWRNIRRNGFHSAINILGLSVGIAFTFLIAAYVWSEFKVNKNLKNVDRQYIIQSKWKDPNMGIDLTTIGALPKALKEQYPSLVANYYRWDGLTSNVSKDDKHFREGLQVCDSTMIDMYGFKLVYGNPATAFNDPFSVVITENRAKKYFNRTNVVGESLTIENFSGTKHDFIISGVLEDYYENSVTKLIRGNDNQLFIPVSNLKFFNRDMENWFHQYIIGYVELHEGIKPEDLKKPIEQLIKQNTSSQVSANLEPYLLPLSGYYINKENGLVKRMLFTVSCIALFILLMAIINFINVSISKSTGRIKEIGVRKVMGGMKNQLLFQFLIESTLLVFLSTILSFLIYYLAAPTLSGILGRTIPNLFDFPVTFYLIPFSLIFIIGFLSGIYPALVLSSLKAVDSLKGKLKSIKENIILRKSLVGFQFCIASIVFIGAIIISKQVNYFFSKQLGYDKEFIVAAQVPRDWTTEGINRMNTIRNEFATLPELNNVSLSYEIPNGNNVASFPVYTKGKDSTQAVAMQIMVTDGSYDDTYKIPLVAGSYFDEKFSPADSFDLVINETATKAFGFKSAEEALGKQLIFPDRSIYTVKGVTRDFHFGSMQDKIEPLNFIHVNKYGSFRYLSFKLKPGNISKSIEALQKKWSTLFPGVAFDYSFMNDTLAKLYQSEIRLKKAAFIATILAFVIVLLGIIGIVSMSIQKRTKEIGIRKVLGASVSNIISLFLKDFIAVIIIAGLISIPVAWFIMKSWLLDYAYRIPITLQPFLLSIFGLALITAILISIQTAKASIENPVKSLRSE